MVSSCYPVFAGKNPELGVNYGMTHIGRLDLELDAKAGGIVGHKWKLVEINDSLCEFDTEADSYVDHVLFERKSLNDDCLI